MKRFTLDFLSVTVARSRAWFQPYREFELTIEALFKFLALSVGVTWPKTFTQAVQSLNPFNAKNTTLSVGVELQPWDFHIGGLVRFAGFGASVAFKLNHARLFSVEAAIGAFGSTVEAGFEVRHIRDAYARSFPPFIKPKPVPYYGSLGVCSYCDECQPGSQKRYDDTTTSGPAFERFGPEPLSGIGSTGKTTAPKRTRKPTARTPRK